MTAFRAEIRLHGQVLSRPVKPTEGTTCDVGYELGQCLQLDRDHCLLVASLDEQGGGDKCVGNDAFVFSSLDEITPDRSIPLNRPDPAFRLKSTETGWMAKYPAAGGFIPLGQGMENGAGHPGQGTGLLVSTGITFRADGTSLDNDSECAMEFMQLGWDGRELGIQSRTYLKTLHGFILKNTPLSPLLSDGDGLLAPFATDQGTVVFRFEFQSGQWTCVAHGKPFGSCREMEPSLRKAGGYYWLHTRGADPVGRLYRSVNGLDFQPLREEPLHTVPQSLNKGLDGNLYLATNPFPTPPAAWIRNPLIILPLAGGGYGAPIVVHDQGGIRSDTGDSIPFIDHAVSSNVFLEGRMRHLLWYRVCDLKERTAYACQPELAKLIGKPKPRMTTSGLYLAEMIYSPGET